MSFSLAFFEAIVFGAIALAALAAIFLPILFIRDALKGRIW